MYQYRSEIERIATNIDRDEAWKYARSLYAKGFISLNEWKILSKYSKEYKKSYEKAGIK